MGCCSRFALFVLNFFVFAIGLAAVVMASLVISKDSVYGDLLASGVFSLPIGVLVAGLAILLLGFLGCCGALKENSCMLQTYAGIVLLLFIAEVVLGVLILVYTDKAESIITDAMKDSFNKYGLDDQSLTKSLDAAQHELKCCGVESYEDWSEFSFGNTSGNVAEGCCLEMSKGCGDGVANLPLEAAQEKVYVRGCYHAIKDDLGGLTIGLGVISVILGLVQLVSISCACGLARKSSYHA